jgi:hypothetical protein
LAAHLVWLAFSLTTPRPATTKIDNTLITAMTVNNSTRENAEREFERHAIPPESREGVVQKELAMSGLDKSYKLNEASTTTFPEKQKTARAVERHPPVRARRQALARLIARPVAAFIR